MSDHIPDSMDNGGRTGLQPPPSDERRDRQRSFPGVGQAITVRLPGEQLDRLRGPRWWDRVCLGIGLTCLVGSWVALIVVIWTAAAGIARTMSDLRQTPFQTWISEVFDARIMSAVMALGVFLVSVFVVRDVLARRWNARIVRDWQAQGMR